MEDALKELKTNLRSLVVSSPTEVDWRTLLRDYRNLMGETIPFSKFGYRDGLTFIKERCNDCFVIRESGCNPVLTVIVPDSVKHIDGFVQKQKSTPVNKFKGKRRSIPQSAVKGQDSVVKTVIPQYINLNKTAIEESKEVLHDERSNIFRTKVQSSSRDNVNIVCDSNEDDRGLTNGDCIGDALHNFMKKRMPMFNSSQYLDSESCMDKESSKADTDSGRQTSSSNSSSRKALLEELKAEIREVVADMAEGVWCTELLRLYREKYGRELNFGRFGFTSVLSLAYAVEGLRCSAAEHTGDVLLCCGAAPVPAVSSPARVRAASAASRAAPAPPAQPDDALPGIDYDEDVFPRDCMHLVESIPAATLDGLAPGAALPVVLGEVYSPTHFWILRLGPQHYGAMEDVMDEMNEYYQRGEGRERVLAGGALRVGHYCACCYEGDWHRAVIVKIIDSDTVKVRHVDYATVEAVPARGLRPLLRRWAALPAQAVRARLAGAQPPAAGRRWPRAAAAHFLRLVRERRLVAYVVAIDAQESILEVLLVDTSTEDDVCISTEMCRSGHADRRPDSALGTSECYLYPRFGALENGDTPNYEEIHCYLRDGISLEFVEDYRRHVPSCLPPPASPSPAPSPPAATRSPSPPAREPAVALGPSAETTWVNSVAVANRIPLFRPESPDAGPRPRPERSASAHAALAESAADLLPAPLEKAKSDPRAALPMPSTEPLPERPSPRRARPPQGAQSLPPGAFPASPYPHPGSLPPGALPAPPYAHPSPPPDWGPHPLPMPPHPFVGPFSPVHLTPYAPHPPVHLSPYAPPFFPQLVPPAPPVEGGVSVPASECEIFALLGRVDPAAAHRYMVDALRRATARPSATLPAPRVCTHTQTDCAPLRPPPGFQRRA